MAGGFNPHKENDTCGITRSYSSSIRTRASRCPRWSSATRASSPARNGIVHRLEDWGRRQLTYPLQKVHKAHYVLMNIECDQETVDELDHSFKFSDAVLRHLIVKMTKAGHRALPDDEGGEVQVADGARRGRERRGEARRGRRPPERRLDEANRVELSGTLAELGALRHTPAGIPVIEVPHPPRVASRRSGVQAQGGSRSRGDCVPDRRPAAGRRRSRQCVESRRIFVRKEPALEEAGSAPDQDRIY